MRIVVGSIQQETNSFNPVSSCIDDFTRVEGAAMLPWVAVTQYLEEEGCEILPTLYANAVPAGRLEAVAFEELLQGLLDRFPSEGPVDGVWLYCHGALDVDGIGSGDVAILEAVRRRVGQDVPIAVALDFHANLDGRIAGLANIVCGYRTAPHTDMAETQLRAARLLVESIRHHELPRVALVQVPTIVSGDKVITAVEPMRSIIEASIRCGDVEGLLDASVFNGQPWVDAVNTGASALVVARGERFIESARVEAHHLARLLWDARTVYRFQAAALEPEDAVEQALHSQEFPVFLSDSGDNTTAGAPGNSVLLLRMLLGRPRERVLLAGLTLPRTVDLCRTLDVGDTVPMGGEVEFDRLMQESGLRPVLHSRGRILGWDGSDAGDAVVLSVPGMDMILTERRCAVVSPEIIESVGISFNEYRVIVVKLGYLYPKLAEVARKAYLALTPGASCETIERIPYTRIRRPIYPIDTDFEW
jgi:microcystin degradation protein MlrC